MLLKYINILKLIKKKKKTLVCMLSATSSNSSNGNIRKGVGTHKTFYKFIIILRTTYFYPSMMRQIIIYKLLPNNINNIHL